MSDFSHLLDLIGEFIPFLIIVLISGAASIYQAMMKKQQNKRPVDTSQTVPRPTVAPVRTAQATQPRRVSTISSLLPKLDDFASSTPKSTMSARLVEENAPESRITQDEKQDGIPDIATIKPIASTKGERHPANTVPGPALDRIEALPRMQKAIVWAEILKNPYDRNDDLFDM